MTARSTRRPAPPPIPVEGTIVRLQPYREADLIVKIISESHGKISMMARHARRSRTRFPSSLDLFDTGTFQVHLPREGSNLGTIDGFVRGESFRALQSDLDRIIAATVVAEAFELVTPEYIEGEPLFFFSLGKTLATLTKQEGPKEILRTVYFALIRLLEISGHRAPEADLQPSSKSLHKLISEVEQASERELRSKGSLDPIVGSLRQTHSTPPT